MLQSGALSIDHPNLPSFSNILKECCGMSNSFITASQTGEVCTFNISWLHALLQFLHKTNTNPQQSNSNSMPVNSRYFSPSLPLIHVPQEPQLKRTHLRELFVLRLKHIKFHLYCHYLSCFRVNMKSSSDNFPIISKLFPLSFPFNYLYNFLFSSWPQLHKNWDLNVATSSSLCFCIYLILPFQ